MTFARHLKQIMVMKDINQTQLATRSGLSKASISQLLSGKQNPRNPSRRIAHSRPDNPVKHP